MLSTALRKPPNQYAAFGVVTDQPAQPPPDDPQVDLHPVLIRGLVLLHLPLVDQHVGVHPGRHLDGLLRGRVRDVDPARCESRWAV